MANIGDLVRPGQSAPEAGTYQCSASGCTSIFRASVKGVPLPPAHHAGGTWKLTEKAATSSGSEAGTLRPAAGTAPAATPAKPVAKAPQPGKGSPQPGFKPAPGSTPPSPQR